MWNSFKYVITFIYLIILQLPIKLNLQHGNECHIKYPNPFFIISIILQEERDRETTKDWWVLRETFV